MKERLLGKSGLKVSAVGMGCMGLSHGYGAPVDRKEAVYVVQKAFDVGYTFFDTAEIYGTPDNPHINEEIVGEALKGRRDKAVIATKFGISFDTESGKTPYPLITDSSAKRIRSSVEGSLKRLKTDYIDLYFQHRIDKKVPAQEVALVMADLMKEGKIRAWGISEADEEYLRAADAVCPVAAVQNRYSMMARWYESLFPVLEELNIAFVAFSPMANGFLTGRYGRDAEFDARYDYRHSMPQFKAENIEKNRELLELLQKFAQDKNATCAQISLAWMICKKPWIVPIPGSRKIERLKENSGAAEIELTDKETAALDKALDGISMSEVFGGTSIKE